MELLGYLGHQEKKRHERRKYSYIFKFRQLPQHWVGQFEDFLKGQSQDAVESLVLGLLENAAARAHRDEVQDHFNNLKRFWKQEVLSLNQAIMSAAFTAYPVPQKDRDSLFLRHRYGR
jgi:hypothetical protein